MKNDSTNYNWEENTREGICNDRHKCMRSLQAVLDGEASKEEEEDFLAHIEDCMPCYKLYSMEKAIKEVVLQKIEKKPVPPYLINSIRNKFKNL